MKTTQMRARTPATNIFTIVVMVPLILHNLPTLNTNQTRAFMVGRTIVKVLRREEESCARRPGIEISRKSHPEA